MSPFLFTKPTLSSEGDVGTSYQSLMQIKTSFIYGYDYQGGYKTPKFHDLHGFYLN